MGTYVLRDFGGYIGYKIEEQELYKIMNIAYPERNYGDGWYEKTQANLWKKGDKKRKYLKLKRYRNHQFRSEKELGYYDSVTGIYVVIEKYHRTKDDVIKKYNEMN